MKDVRKPKPISPMTQTLCRFPLLLIRAMTCPNIFWTIKASEPHKVSSSCQATQRHTAVESCWTAQRWAQCWPCFSSDFPACQSWPTGKSSPRDIAREQFPAGDLAHLRLHSVIIYLLRNIRTLLPSSSHAIHPRVCNEGLLIFSTARETFPSGVQCGHPLSSVIGGRCRWGRNLRRECLCRRLRERRLCDAVHRFGS